MKEKEEKGVEKRTKGRSSEAPVRLEECKRTRSHLLNLSRAARNCALVQPRRLSHRTCEHASSSLSSRVAAWCSSRSFVIVSKFIKDLALPSSLYKPRNENVFQLAHAPRSNYFDYYSLGQRTRLSMCVSYYAFNTFNSPDAFI